ncbi:MAG: protein kinase, partial [Myxococcota bacterium]
MDEQPTRATKDLVASQPKRPLAAPTASTSDAPSTPVSRAAAAQAQLTTGTRIGHYELIRELGRGGMGVVFLARDIRLVRRVAIKFLLTHSPRSNARFLSEAQATARCRHDNIVVIYDVGEFCSMPFMVLEYLRGSTVHELLDGSPMSVPRTLDLMVPVVGARGPAPDHRHNPPDHHPAHIVVTHPRA